MQCRKNIVQRFNSYVFDLCIYFLNISYFYLTLVLTVSNCLRFKLQLLFYLFLLNIPLGIRYKMYTVIKYVSRAVRRFLPSVFFITIKYIPLI